MWIAQAAREWGVQAGCLCGWEQVRNPRDFQAPGQFLSFPFSVVLVLWGKWEINVCRRETEGSQHHSRSCWALCGAAQERFVRRGGWLQEPHQALWGQVSQAVCAKTSFSIYFYFLGISPKHFQAPLRRPACVWHQLSLNQPPSRSAGATTRSPRGDRLFYFTFCPFFPHFSLRF